MTTAASYFDRKPSSSFRPALSHLQQDPSSPHTPQRTFSSAFSSPSISYRNEEEALIFDFGARHFSAGFAGETAPRCTLRFGPEESRRVGDYRRWLPDYKKQIHKQREDEWGKDRELWHMDLREVDLGLVEDKIERAVREAFDRYLLLDVKSRRILLALPSVVPHQLLSSVLSTIFENFQNPSVALFPTPMAHTVAAGCRSSLVVDIGWRETVVTAIYEYREVLESRTTRAMKKVTLDMVKMLRTYSSSSEDQTESGKDHTVAADFDIAEDITTRIAWCPPTREEAHHTISPLQSSNPSSVEGDPKATFSDPLNNVPSPFPHPPSRLGIPFSSFALPVETALLASTLPRHALDDEEQPLPTIIFKGLLRLPPDVRALCMSHIIITGGGSNIPGLKSRLLAELSTLIKERGWDPVQGNAADEHRKRLQKNVTKWKSRPPQQDVSSHDKGENEKENLSGPPTPKAPTSAVSIPASLQPQVHDEIEEKLRRVQLRGTKPIATGVVRGLESLGAWAGGSLIASLRIRGVVEVERDAFLNQGLAGGMRKGMDAEAHKGQRPAGAGVGIGSEKGGWTLGGWA